MVQGVLPQNSWQYTRQSPVLWCSVGALCHRYISPCVYRSSSPQFLVLGILFVMSAGNLSFRALPGTCVALTNMFGKINRGDLYDQLTFFCVQD